MKKTLALFAAAMLLCTASAGTAQTAAQPTLTYIGHAHLMIITAEGTVIYIDPYKIDGYTYTHNADIILVTHEHSDHNQVDIVPQNDDCMILRVKDTINKDGTYNTFTLGEVTVIPVPAKNKNHDIKKTNGLIVQFDGITVYHAADTDKLDSMADLQQYSIDYAFFPIDGKYNMDAAEAMECAALVGAKHNTPIHWFSADPAAFTPDNLLFMNYGDTITLEKADAD
ncbi:MAG TPA: MBL fold metallo-hydrolase [Candidatus Limiplasma sp.]|nr:MBL fold metallo-hydrolase [Candidatus Limiplasma sp.]